MLGRGPGVDGVVYRPRSGGGPVGLPTGEPPGLVPGGPGDKHDPISAKTGGVPSLDRGLIKNLARIHDPVRVEDALDAAHDLDLPLVEDDGEVWLLDQADTVLAGDDPAALAAVPEELLPDEVGFVLPCALGTGTIRPSS